MGWWSLSSPASGPSAPTDPPASKPSSSPSDLLPPTTATSSPDPPKSLTRDQQAEAELESFLASLEGPTPARAKKTRTQPPAAEQHEVLPSTQQQTASSWTTLWRRGPVAPPQPTSNPDVPPSASTQPEEVYDISPHALRPRTMSCRAAFDSAFYCASLGGKFNDIYRFGALQPCTEHWEAFWFCMRNRSLSGDDDEDKGERIADYYEAREKRELARRAQGRSSEDVWEMRTVPVEKAFWKVP